jgi:hypothetical protein
MNILHDSCLGGPVLRLLGSGSWELVLLGGACCQQLLVTAVVLHRHLTQYLRCLRHPCQYIGSR